MLVIWLELNRYFQSFFYLFWWRGGLWQVYLDIYNLDIWRQFLVFQIPFIPSLLVSPSYPLPIPDKGPTGGWNIGWSHFLLRITFCHYFMSPLHPSHSIIKDNKKIWGDGIGTKQLHSHKAQPTPLQKISNKILVCFRLLGLSSEWDVPQFLFVPSILDLESCIHCSQKEHHVDEWNNVFLMFVLQLDLCLLDGCILMVLDSWSVWTHPPILCLTLHLPSMIWILIQMTNQVSVWDFCIGIMIRSWSCCLVMLWNVCD